jgi:hypothetical protein
MICCLCGEAISIGEAGIHLTQFILGASPISNRLVLRPVPMEDGAPEKFVHSICPAQQGAPLALTGADGSRVDV